MKLTLDISENDLGSEAVQYYKKNIEFSITPRAGDLINMDGANPGDFDVSPPETDEVKPVICTMARVKGLVFSPFYKDRPVGVLAVFLHGYY